MLEFDPTWEQRVREDIKLGYPYFTDRTHPLASKNGKVYVHRHVASLSIGRWVRRDEHVHHKNGDRTDYRPDNLEILTPRAHHRRHAAERPPRVTIPCHACGTLTPNIRFCSPACVHIGQRKTEWPSREELTALMARANWRQIAQVFGVSDNAVRRWAKLYGLVHPHARKPYTYKNPR